MNSHVIILMLLCIVLGESGALAKSDLSCNVMLASYRDWQVKDASGKTGCMTRVERAFQLCGSDVIGILPYQTFLYKREKRGGKSVAFMTAIKYADSRGGSGKGSGRLVYRTPDAALIARFQAGVAECLVHAHKVGFKTIVITPHMNDPRMSLWRNTLAFDPYTKYDGATYAEAMMKPVVGACKAAIAQGAKIRLALQSEMNMAIALYPKEWSRLLKETQAALGSGGKVGVSMNWNKICGEYCRFYPSSMFSQKAEFRNFLESLDFIGISSYPRVWDSYSTSGKMDFDVSLATLDQEMKEFIGIGLADLAKTKNVELQWSEFGVGGGCDSSAECSAKSLKTMAMYTYAMVGNPYGRHRDPWKPTWATKFRTDFYQQAIRRLNSGGAFPISYALMWSDGSMDVCGVDPESTGTKGTYYNKRICDMIYNYNKRGAVP